MRVSEDLASYDEQKIGFHVRAEDNGAYPLRSNVGVVVDLKDEDEFAPELVFNKNVYEFVFEENGKVGSLVGRVAAEFSKFKRSLYIAVFTILFI